MKKLLPLLTLLLALCALCTIASANDALFTFTLQSDGTAIITDCMSATGDLVIPAELDGHAVTAIGDGAFSGCKSLFIITIPDSVTTIGNKVFSYCDSLTSITIPDSVTTIGDYAFYDCESLTRITIPDSVTTIGDSAFSRCTALKTVTVARNSYAEKYCKNNDLPYTYTE